MAEIYRENQEYVMLAIHYHGIGNTELRDKYIEIAITKDASDDTICFLRGLQGKPELIPNEVINRELERYTKHRDWSQRARFYKSLGRKIEAAKDYVEGVKQDLAEDNVFAAAFYLKEFVEEGHIDELFLEAFRRAKANNDLWWQVRALEELGWEKELKAFLLENEEDIVKSGDPGLLIELSRVKGDTDKTAELMKDMARHTHTVQVDERDELTIEDSAADSK